MSGLIIVPNYMPALDTNGRPIPGALMWFYLNNTTTLTTVYADAELSVPLSNPVVADSSGVFPLIFAASDMLFTVAVTTSDGSPLVTYDNIQSSSGVSSNIRFLSSFSSNDDTAFALAAIWIREGIQTVGQCQVPKCPRKLLLEPRLITLTQSVNLQNIAATGWGIEGNGATILATCTGKTLFDLLGSRWGTFEGFNVVGDRTSKPAICFQPGRLAAAVSADGHRWRDITVDGNWTRACIYNLASETGQYDNCVLYNQQDDASTGKCLILDGANYYGAITDFDAPTMSGITYMSCIQHTLLTPDFRVYHSGAPIEAINADQLKMVNGYCVSPTGSGIRIIGGSDGFDLDMHCEPPGVDSNILIEGFSAGEVILRNFKTNDHYCEVATAPIKAGTYATSVRLINADISILKGSGAATNLFSGNFIVSGKVYASSYVPNMNNMSGTLDVSDLSTSANLPGGSYNVIGQGTDGLFKGVLTMAGTASVVTGANLVAGANLTHKDGILFLRSPSVIKQSLIAGVSSATGYTILGGSYTDYASSAWLNTANSLYTAFNTDGSFTIANLSADPASPLVGSLWVNGTSKKFKTFDTGTTRIFNTTP